MIGQVSLLVMLVKLVDRLPEPPAPAKRGRGARKGLAQNGREAGVVLHSSIATEAHWTTSGWHGWALAGSCTWSPPWPKGGYRWQRN